MAEQEQDRSEAATPHKIKQAQERGQVNKSQEVIFAAVLAALVLVLFSMGPSIAREELHLLRQVFDRAGSNHWARTGTMDWLFSLFSAAIGYLFPLFATIIAAAVLANMAQVGVIFSFQPVKPDFDRLSPAQGLKRLFSLTVLYNAVKSIFKLGVLSWLMWVALRPAFDRLLGLMQVDARVHGSVVMMEVAPLLFKMFVLILLLALVDAGYTRWDFSKKMRMSRREVRDEHKNREGDPRIRARLRQLRAEMAKQSKSMRSLPQADVLIVNPTHFAVALSYKHGEMPAPKMLVKGAGAMAATMREAARRHSIPIVQNAPLARAMYDRLKINDYLPEDLYPMAAKILLWVYAARTARARLVAPE
jgi:flagellar biosynthetic protein FlhB